MTAVARAVAVLTLLLTAGTSAVADDSAGVIPHPDGPWWLSGQANLIFQWHPRFRSPYQGDHSLRAEPDRALSRVFTLFTGARLGDHTEVIVDVESAGGRGIGDAFGLAGFTNLDVVRNPSLGSAPYLARAILRHTFAFGSDTVDSERGPLSLAAKLPARRVDVRVGKFGTADFFDLNTVASDSHLQFENWTVDNNGAYDYAADTRGYTVGAEVEYHDRAWTLRFLEALMPKVANGIDLDWNATRAHAENLEAEVAPGWLPGRDGHVRALLYVNHANMGDYAEADAAARDGARPDIEATRRQGRVKYGFGLNADQELSSTVRVGARWGWNEGRHESFAYTEANTTIEAAIDWRGERWMRARDRLGIAVVVNGLSAEHRDYLAAGGLGFLLGDGRLNYGPERIAEGYYNVPLGRGVSLAADIQAIWNPGYNRDRGAVVVPGFRAHVEF